MSQQWLAAAYPYKTGAFGLGINYLSVPPFDAYDNADNAIGKVSAHDMALYLSWGGELPLGSRFLRSVSYGAAFKHISQNLAAEKASGSALDLGFQAAPAVEDLRFGFAIENAIAGELKFISKGARPPMKFKAGAMYELRSSVAPMAAVFTLDYIFWDGRPGYLAVGMEHDFYDTFSVRLGYNGFGAVSNGLNFGLGFNLARYAGRGAGAIAGRDVALDYSVGGTHDFGNIHKLGVTYKFDRPVVAGGSGVRSSPVAPTPGAAERLFRSGKAAVPTAPDDGAGPSAPEAAVTPAPAPLPAPSEPGIDYYLDTLNTGSLDQRRGAIAWLGKRGDEDSLKLLLVLLKDDDPVIIVDVVNILAGFEDPRIMGPLIGLLNTKNILVRLAAAAGLAHYRDERVFKALMARLGDKSSLVRGRTAEILGEWGDARAAASLRAALGKEKNVNARRAMMTALKKLDAGTGGAP